MKRAVLVVSMVAVSAALFGIEFVLADGTVVIGEIEGDVAVRTSFGTLYLSGSAVVSIELSHPAKIEMEDGSRIIGEILGDVLSVRRDDEIVELPILEIASIGGGRVTGGGAPTADTLATVFVAGGTFQMGSIGGASDESPVHTVTVGGFHMTRTEITFEQYDAFAYATGARVPGDEGWGRGRLPVINVSWYDAIAYANWLSDHDELTPVYEVDGRDVTWNRDAAGWRLPTEAEWEYAARGGESTRDAMYAGTDGNGSLGEYANYADRNTDFGWSDESVDDGHEYTAPVGSLRPNELGLSDMSGNVWEWVWDRHGDYSGGAQTNPVGPAFGLARVRRGGSWYSNPGRIRVTYRGTGTPTYAGGDLGFRLVRNDAP